MVIRSTSKLGATLLRETVLVAQESEGDVVQGEEPEARAQQRAAPMAGKMPPINPMMAPKAIP